MSTESILGYRSELNQDAEHLMHRLQLQGVADVYFSREDYTERLDEYIDRAHKRFVAVSNSFRLAKKGGDICAVIRRKLAIEGFKVSISLLNPDSEAANLVREQIGWDANDFDANLACAAHDLVELRNSLPENQSSRLEILTHSCLPFGTGYLIDCEEKSGIIHLESRLFGSSLKEVFGYRIVGPSEFFSYNYRAWMAVIAKSKPIHS